MARLSAAFLLLALCGLGRASKVFTIEEVVDRFDCADAADEVSASDPGLADLCAEVTEVQVDIADFGLFHRVTYTVRKGSSVYQDAFQDTAYSSNKEFSYSKRLWLPSGHIIPPLSRVKLILRDNTLFCRPVGETGLESLFEWVDWSEPIYCGEEIGETNLFVEADFRSKNSEYVELLRQVPDDEVRREELDAAWPWDEYGLLETDVKEKEGDEMDQKLDVSNEGPKTVNGDIAEEQGGFGDENEVEFFWDNVEMKWVEGQTDQQEVFDGNVPEGDFQDYNKEEEYPSNVVIDVDDEEDMDKRINEVILQMAAKGGMSAADLKELRRELEEDVDDEINEEGDDEFDDDEDPEPLWVSLWNDVYDSGAELKQKVLVPLGEHLGEISNRYWLLAPTFFLLVCLVALTMIMVGVAMVKKGRSERVARMNRQFASSSVRRDDTAKLVLKDESDDDELLLFSA